MARAVEGGGKLKFVNNLGPESACIHPSERERERERVKENICQEEKRKERRVLTLKQVEKGEADYHKRTA